MLKYILLTILITIQSQIAFAQTVDSIHNNWAIFTVGNKGYGKKCYISASPVKKIGNHKKKREPYMLITRFNNKRVEEVSIYAGYEYRLNSQIYISIDGQQYKLFTYKDVAWTKTPIQDKEIIKRLLRGRVVKVRSESAIGTYSVDEYSLTGITKAYRRMKELCS